LVELVANPKGQKGGLGLKLKGSDYIFLLEGLNTKTDEIQNRLEQLTKQAEKEGLKGLPYNAFRLIYKLSDLEKLLKKGLPYLSLRYREDEELIHPEPPTGDITQIEGAKAVALMRKFDRFIGKLLPEDKDYEPGKGELIHDFKSLDQLTGARFILLNQDKEPQFKKLVNEYINKDGGQIEQFQLDTVVTSSAYLQGFDTKKLGKVIIRGENDFEIEKLENLDYAYQDRLKQIIGFVSHYINGPPLEVDLTIVPCQINKPSMWQAPSLNTIHLQVILLTGEIPIEYAYFVAYYNFILIKYKGVDRKKLLEEIKLYLQQSPDMRYKLYDFWLKEFTPIKTKEISLLPLEAKERLNEKYDKLVKEFYDKEIDVNVIYNNPDYYDLSKKDKNGLPVPFREEAASILAVPFLGYKGGERLLSNIKDIRKKINKIFEKFNLNAEDYIVWINDNLLHTSIFTVKKSYKENLSDREIGKNSLEAIGEILGNIERFTLTFNRVIMDKYGYVLVVGYTQGSSLSILRDKLLERFPTQNEAHNSLRQDIIHITLGRTKRKFPQYVKRELEEFIKRYRNLHLGEIEVDKLRYIKSKGPIFSFTIEDIFVKSLKDDGGLDFGFFLELAMQTRKDVKQDWAQEKYPEYGERVLSKIKEKNIIDHTESDKLADLKLWPVQDNFEINFSLIEWMAQNNNSPPEEKDKLLDKYEKAPKVSLRDITENINYERIRKREALLRKQLDGGNRKISFDLNKPLSKQIEDLISQQINDGVVADWFKKEKIKYVKRDIFSIQINPGRHPDKKPKLAIGKEGCFLCEENMPEKEKGIALDKEWTIYPNPSPYEKNHVVLVYEKTKDEHPFQVINKFRYIRKAIDLIWKLNIEEERCEFNLTFNSIKAAASSSHFHYQIFEVNLPIVEFEPIFIQNGEVKIGTISNYPAKVLIIEGSKENVASKLWQIINILNAGYKRGFIPYNILFKGCREEKTIRVYIFPRKVEKPADADKDLMDIKFGICEMCGMAIVYDETMVKPAQIFKKSLEVASLSVEELLQIPLIRKIIKEILSLPEAKELRNLLKDSKTYSLDGGFIFISEEERDRFDGGKYSSASKKSDNNYSKLLIIFEENKELLEKYIEKCRKIFGYTRDEIIEGPFHKDSKKTTFQKYSLLIFPQIKKFTMQKDSASSEKPIVLALGGGTGLLVTIKALVKLGVKVISVQCSIDDGGSTFRLIKALIEKGYGWFPSPGDLVNSLFQGFASQDKLYKLLDDQGRIEVKKIKDGNQEKEKIVFYGGDNNIEYLDSFEELIIKLLQRIVAYTVGSQKDKGIGYFKKTYTLGDDFVWFAAGVINLTKRINRYFKKGIIPLKGASIRNLLLLGAIDYLGLIDIDNPPYEDAEVEKKYTSSVDNPLKASQFQASLDKLAEMAGIYNGKVTLSHHKPATVYCIYEENVVIIQGDNNRNIALVVKVEEDKIKITIPTYRNETYILTFQRPFHKINIEGITIKLIRTREGKFSFQINNSPQATLLSEPQKKEEVYNTYIKYEGKEYLLANDGTGRIIFKDEEASQKENEDIYVYSHLTMGGKKVYILSRFNAMQTCVTETVNFSKIIDFGIVEIEGWRKIKIKEGEYEEEPIYKPSNARVSPNEELIKVINNEEVKAIIIGPGSFFTSILPHLLVRGLPEALAERRKRGDIPIVLVLNPTIDNETHRLSLEDIWRFIEEKTGYRVDELFTDVIFPRLDTTKLEEYFEISNPSFSWYVEKIVESEELINELRLSYINILINRFQEKLKLPRVSLDKDAPRYRLLNDDGKKLRILKENKEIELEEVNLFEYLEAKIYEFLKTLKETRNPDIRTDKGAASKEAKKSVGAFNYSYEDIQKTKSIYPRLNLHWDVYTVGIDYVLPRKPGESPKPRVGFLLDYTYPVLGEILNLTSKEEEIYQAYKKVTEEAGVLLEPFEAFTTYRAKIREKLSEESADYFEMIGRERFEKIIQKRLLSDRFHEKPENFNLNLPLITFSVKLTQKGFSIKEKGNKNYKDVLLKVLNDLLQSVHLIEEEFKIVITTDQKLLSFRISHHNISGKIIYLHPEFFKESLENQKKFLYHELVSHISNKEPYEPRAVIDTERFMKAPYPLRLYRKAKAYIEDGRHPHALYLLSQAQISLLQEKEGDEIIDSFLKEIEGLKEYIEKNPNFRLNTLFLQVVKEDTGEIIQNPEEGKANWIEVHMKGIWHLNVHILIFNSKGGILLHRRRDKKGKRDISATHHLFFGEKPQEAAKRIIKEDTGLSYINEKTLIELELPQGKKKKQ